MNTKLSCDKKDINNKLIIEKEQIKISNKTLIFFVF